MAVEHDMEPIMKEIFSTVAFELSPGERIAISVRRGEALRVSGERVWVTRSNDAVDYFLHDGDALSLRADETLWLSVDGLGTSRVTFALAAGTGHRLATVFRRWWDKAPIPAAGGKLGMRIG